MESCEENTASQRRKFYKQRYKQEWEQRFTWIQSSRQGSTFSFCKICAVDIIATVTAAVRHKKSQKHLRKSTSIRTESESSVISTLPGTSTSSSYSRDMKEIDIRIVAYVIEHSSPIRSAKHLSNLIKKIVQINPEAAANNNMGRTKCNALIKNIGEYSKSLVIEDLRNNIFSILIDESTDYSSIKQLAIVARYVKNGIVYDRSLELIPIADASARHIYDVIVAFFVNHDINYTKNLVGFAADGANNMMGKNNSVQALLKKDVPHLVIVKCLSFLGVMCILCICKITENNTQLNTGHSVLSAT